MNLTINIPLETAERMARALESIADSLLRYVGPPLPVEPPKPYPRDYWGTTDPRDDMEHRELEKQEASGYGPTYKQQFDKIAEQIIRPPQPTRKPPSGSIDNP